jgi:hypothetical protein
MTAQSKSRFKGATLAVFAAVILTQCGCNIGIEMDPATTVTVKINGVKTGGDAFAVKKGIEERLQAMAASTEPLMTSSMSGDTMLVKLSPVGDVMEFARQISFGEITDIEGRTIVVRFLK